MPHLTHLPGEVRRHVLIHRRPLAAVLAALAADAELVTCIAGEGAPLDAEAIAALAPSSVELELEDGGQPSYWWLLTAE